ncbi:MAG: peptidylprolyl isomerase [Pseudomonadota bacterium]
MPRQLSLAALLLLLVATTATGQNPVVSVATPVGDFQIELRRDTAPNTVANFLNYVSSGRYEDSFIHRSDPGFVIQGGGFTFSGFVPISIEADDPIANEFGLSNVRGTVAMARRAGSPDSATSQWFINLGDNRSLDDVDGGFTVFGEVIGDGMDVVDAIAALPTFDTGSFRELPLIDYDTDNAITTDNYVFTEVTVVDEGVAPVSTFVVDPGVTGAWFNPATAGQGWLLDVYPGNDGNLEMFLAWFTYAAGEPPADEGAFGSSQHRWFTASGTVDGDTATLTIFRNTGGVFNDPRSTELEAVGTMTVVFTSCSEAVMSWVFDTEGGTGEVAITRLTPDSFCGL